MMRAADFVIECLAFSTLFLGAAWLLGRFTGLAVREAAWKCALVLCVVVPAGSGAATLWKVRDGERVSLFIRDRAVLQELGVARPMAVMPGGTSVRRMPPAIFQARRVATWALLVGAIAGVFRLVIQWHRTMRQLGPRQPVRLEQWMDFDPAQTGRLPGLTRVRFSVASGLAVPAVVGRREVCLPQRMPGGFGPLQLNAVLAHELAHVQRRDLDWIRCAALLEALLPIQPLLRVARRELTTIAEFRADDAAVRSTADRAALVEALLAFARSSPDVRPVGVLTFTGAQSQFLTRSRRILNGTDAAAPLRIGWVIALAAMLGLFPGAFELRPRRGPRQHAEVVTRRVAPRENMPLVQLSEQNRHGSRQATITRAADGTLQTTFVQNGDPVPASPELQAWLRTRLAPAQ